MSKLVWEQKTQTNFVRLNFVSTFFRFRIFLELELRPTGLQKNMTVYLQWALFEVVELAGKRTP